MRDNNKGLSLVELIVAIAIMAIVGLAIGGFMVTGTRSYASSSAEVNLQYEAQLVSNQINDLLIDSVGDIVYQVGGVNTIDEGSSPATDKEKNLFLCTHQIKGGSESYVVHKVNWKPGTDENKVYYSQYPATYDEAKHEYTYSAGSATYQDKLMGEYIDSFSVNLENAVSSNNGMQFLKLTQHLKNREREYTSESNITLRNSVSINSVSVVPDSSDPSVSGNATGIVITPVSAVVAPGKSQKFNATVKAVGKVDRTIDWTIEGADKAGTTVDTAGKVTIASDETADNITVIATLHSNTSISKSASISIKAVDSVVIDSNPSNIEQNQTFSLKATVSGRNITNSAADQAVKWRVVEGGQYVTLVGANKFKVSSLTPVGTIVKISATSVIDTEKSDTRTFDVKKAAGSSDDDDEDEDGTAEFTEWPQYINRGDSGTFTVKNNVPNSSITWKVEVTAKDGSKTITYKEGTGYVLSKKDKSITVNVKKAIDYEQEAKVRVTAIIKKTGTSNIPDKELYVTSTVLPVTMKLKKNETDTPQNAISGLQLYYLKTKKTEYYYELTGIVNDDITWGGSNYDKKILGIKMDKSKQKVTLSVPSDKANGTTKAVAYLGSYNLGCSISASVAKGNIYFESNNVKTYFYMPYPDDDDFPWTSSHNDGMSRGAGFVDYNWADMDDLEGSEHYKVYYYYDKFQNPKRWYIAISPTGEKWRIGSNKYYCVVGTRNWVRQ